MKLKSICTGFVCGISLLSSALAADETLFGRATDRVGPKKSSLTFTMYGGNYWFGRDQELFDWRDYYSKTWHPGLRVGWAFTRYLETEVSFGFVWTQTSLAKQKVYYGNVNAVGQYPNWGMWVPYATFGLGGILFETVNRASEQDFAINYGGGIKIFLAKNLAIRPDVRGLTSFGPNHTALLTSINLTYYAFLGSREKMAETLPPDRDGDGIPDMHDKCPDSPETVNNYSDQDGCPDKPPDADRDGISDDQDQCPDKPETFNKYKDEDGCPDRELDQFSGVIEGIFFQKESNIIRKDSFTTLNLAAGFFTRHPALRFRIEGHADTTGTKEFNKKLSQKRAESVRQYLLQKGVAKGQMEAVGFGDTRPIASNKTKEGRKQNRRIEFKILNPEVLSGQE